MKRLKVAVLMGGTSSEREVSLRSGLRVAEALDPGKYEVCAVDACTGPVAIPDGEAVSVAPLAVGGPLARSKAAGLVSLMANGFWPDVVFIALHGKYGEDGTVQGLLELLQVPYTGSGVLASALAMNKAVSKKLLAAEGVRTPPFVLATDPGEALSRAPELPLPLVVKPNRQGSTIGLSIVRQPGEIEDAIALAFQHDTEVLLEQFVEGTEITASVIGNRELEVLPLVEIVPEGGFYDYHAKYTPGATQEIVPARIPEGRAREARELATRSHKALGCRGMSRVDMICTADAVWVLEVNTIPGMTETSLLPRAAAAAGISFPELVDRLVQLALEQ